MTTRLLNILKKNNINYNDIIEYYKDHSLKQTSEKFNISSFVIEKILKENNIPAHTKKENTEFTTFERYGCKNVAQSKEVQEKIQATCNERYGVPSYFQTDECKEKVRKTCNDKYGVDYPGQIPERIEKAKQTSINKFGLDNYNNREQFRQTMTERYGDPIPLHIDAFKEKSVESSIEKYGVPYNCMRDEARMHGNNSNPNKLFAKLLEENNLIHCDNSIDDYHYSREFCLKSFSYDFKINNILIEIDPIITHNTFYSPFGRDPIDKDYHKNKSLLATNNNYRCIHIFDWEDQSKIIKLLLHNTKIYARDCEIHTVDTQEASKFINKNHIQGYAKSKINIGLYYNNELVSIMTFDKPRYNTNYEYELIRYCSSYNIIGGSEKLFKYFINNYNPQSIISYCDLSKFNGNTYLKLGFKLKNNKINPSKHWYNQKTKQHITDNLLRQRGFDQLFGTNFGKGTSNDQLMLDHGFLPIYDCGQAGYIWSIK